MRIQMVCLGNICRSPLAEGILKHKVKERGLDWYVESSGTGSWHVDCPADSRSIAIAKKYGIDLSEKRGRQFSAYDFERFDRIYVMDRSNLQNVLRLAQTDEERAKVKLIRNETHPDQDLEVPDPYHDDNGFEEVYQMLDAACEEIIKRELAKRQEGD
jgi:protein-tyrosine phosphatase